MLEIGQLLVAAALALSTIMLGILNYRRNTRIRALEAQVEFLRRRLHKVSSKVDPEADRKLVVEAGASVQILGINSLGPLHHSREEIIGFLKERGGALRIVLLDPASAAFEAREVREGDGTGRIRSEWRASVNILRDIARHSGGRIELRLRSDAPDRALLMIDSAEALSDRSRMLVNYYPDEPGMRGYSGAQFLAEFALERDRDTMFKNAEYFARVWEGARAVELDEAHSAADSGKG